MEVLGLSISRTELNDITSNNKLPSIATRIWDTIVDWFCNTQQATSRQTLYRFLGAKTCEAQQTEFRKLKQLADPAYQDMFSVVNTQFKIGDMTFDAKISKQDLSLIERMDSDKPITNTARILYANGKNVLASIFDTAASHFEDFNDDDLASSLLSNGEDVKIVQVSDGGGSSYVKEMTRLIRSATETVEISMLTPPEIDTPTYNELVQAFADLAKTTEKTIDIRIVYGRMPAIIDSQLKQTHINEKTYLEKLINDIKEKTEKDPVPFNMQFTGFSNSGVSLGNLLSWNHSKIIVIDRKTCNIGGTNLYEGYNHDANPIRDISTTYEKNSRLATQAANFIYGLATSEDQRWSPSIQRITQTQTAMYTQNTNTTVIISPSKKVSNSVAEFIPAKKLDQLTSDECANVDTIAVSRYGVNSNGSADIERKNLSDVMLPTLIRQAQNSLVISQQTIAPMNKIAGITVGHSHFNEEMISAIKDALKSGVQVTIIKSPSGSVASDGGVYDGLHSDDIRKLLDAVGDQNLVILAPAKVVDGNIVTSPNHAKVIIVDEEAAYIGSHNVYDASHAEYGIISVNKDFVQQMHSEYIVRGFYGNQNQLRL